MTAPSVEVFAERTDAARRAAEILAEVLRRRRRPVLVLASGKTMVPVYRELAGLHRAGRAPFRRASTFNLDELRVPAADPRSFRSFMERHLFSRVDLPSERIHFLAGDARNAARECRRYERELQRHGPPDLALVGIGANGHVAYVEPGRSLVPRTSLVRLAPSTRKDLAAGGMRPVPREALTMGIESILSAREILLVATGSRKARVLARALAGPVSAACPGSYLSLHPRLTVVLDRPAGALLNGRPRRPRARRRRESWR